MAAAPPASEEKEVSAATEAIVAGIDRNIQLITQEMKKLEDARGVLLGKPQRVRVRMDTRQVAKAVQQQTLRRRHPAQRRKPGVRQAQALAEIKSTPGISTVALAQAMGLNSKEDAYHITSRLATRGLISGTHKGWDLTGSTVKTGE